MGFWKKRRKADKATEERPAKGKRSKKRKRRIAPVEVKIMAMEALESGLTVTEVAALAGVSTTSVHKWRKAWRQDGVSGLARKARSESTRKICSQLEERIVARRQEEPSKGVRRIRDDLKRDEGLAVSAETVRKVVNDAGLGQDPVKAKRRPVQVRRFERSLPNALWQIDIFTFDLKRMYKVYLVGMIDDHSRYIVGHGLFRQQKGQAVMEVVKGAIGQWGAPREILSDNGRQFVAWRGKSEFQKMLRRQGVGHVRSAPHHPQTLGKIERFWKTLWTEFLQDALFASFADARQRLDHWVAYYNHQRPHQGIDGACPADRFYGVSGDVQEAVRQGCADNALRLALGQEPERPLFLLGKLGDTDVRVVRKGDDIEVRLGDKVREIIRLGAPYEADSQGRLGRQEAGDEVEGARRQGEMAGAGADEEGRRPAQGDLRALRGEQADPVSGDGQGGRRGPAGAAASDGGPEGAEPAGGCAGREQGADRRPEQGAGSLEDQVRSGAGLPGTGTDVRPGRTAGDAEDDDGVDGGKKTSGRGQGSDRQAGAEQTPVGRSWSEWPSSSWEADEAGGSD